MTLVQWNIRGYRSNYYELRNLISDSNASCICLQETKIGNSIPFCPRGFDIFTSNRVDGEPHGGVAILVRRELPHIEIDITTPLQATAIQVQLNKFYTICSLYLPPSEEVPKSDIEQLIDQLPEPFLILGDYNARSPLWGDHTVNTKGRVFEQILARTSHGLLNDGRPTHLHIATDTLSCIDLSLCSGSALSDFSWDISDSLYNSDHFPIFISCNESSPPVRTKRYNLNKANWKLFREKSQTIGDASSFDNINQAIDYLYEIIRSAASDSIPLTNDWLPRKPKPWWDRELSQSFKEKNKKLKIYQNTRLVQDKINFKRARAEFRNKLKKKKTQSWNEYISSINSETPLNKIWKKVHKINGKYKACNMPVLKHNGNLISDPLDVGNLMGDTLSTISKGSQDPNFLKNKRQLKPLRFSGGESEDYNLPITTEEYNYALSLCKLTAPGEDEICYQMLRNVDCSTNLFILSLFNRIYNQHEFPSLWRRSIVIPFAKPGKDPKSPFNYRPISLTSCLCKLMEKIINKRLMWQLEASKIISPNQNGYRQNRGTMDALIQLDTAIKHSFINKEHMLVVYFDLEKAYDTTWRQGIMENLHSFGFRGHMPIFIQNFLMERTFNVKIGSTFSNNFSQHEGVPQGSVLSCTLFLLAINNISKCLPNDIKSILYVDDLTLYTSSARLPNAERRMQIAINNIYKWTRDRGFRFSLGKSEAMHFTKVRGTFPPPSLSLNNLPLKVVRERRFLGMIFDDKLSWIQHMKYLKSRCFSAMNILKCLSCSSWGSDRQTLMKLYRSLVRSRLDYGCEIYSSAAKSTLQIIDPIHHMGLRLATGAFGTSPVESLYAETAEQSLYNRRIELSLKLYVRIKAMSSTVTYKCVQNESNDVKFTTQRYHSTLGYRVRQHIDKLNIGSLDVCQSRRFIYKPWTLPINPLCNGLTSINKKDFPSNIIKGMFNDHCNEFHNTSIHIYTDGSKNNNQVGFAAVLPSTSFKRKLPPNDTVFTAELCAILTAIPLLIPLDDTNITIFSESISALQSITNKFSNHPLVKEIHIWIKMVSQRGKSINFCWIPSHVGIQGNETADTKAKEAAIEERYMDRPLPFKDFYPKINNSVAMLWQQSWHLSGTKLREIKDNIRQWETSLHKNRKLERTLARLRIGHTRLTHRYLLEGDVPPLCEECYVQLTVKHIMTECPEFREQRITHFGKDGIREPITLKEILDDNPDLIQHVYDFLVETEIYYLI